jgi:hypothetical protein
VEEGILPGGGVAVLRSRRALVKLEGKLKGDESIGVAIVNRALSAPVKQIATNTGLDGSIVAQKVEESKDNNFGFNALTHEYEDLVKAGVIVPTKVERVALQNAASIAALLLTTDCAITEIKDKKSKSTAGAGAGMDDMDYRFNQESLAAAGRKAGGCIFECDSDWLQFGIDLLPLRTLLFPTRKDNTAVLAGIARLSCVAYIYRRHLPTRPACRNASQWRRPCIVQELPSSARPAFRSPLRAPPPHASHPSRSIAASLAIPTCSARPNLNRTFRNSPLQRLTSLINHS